MKFAVYKLEQANKQSRVQGEPQKEYKLQQISVLQINKITTPEGVQKRTLEF